jgi:hypothetical protein
MPISNGGLTVMRKLPAVLMALALGCGFAAHADTLTLRDDIVSASIEQFFSTPFDHDSLNSQSDFQDVWVYAGLPGFKVLGKSVFCALEMDLMDRIIDFRGERLNSSSVLMQRYGVFAGVTLIDFANQKGTVMAEPGVASDFGRSDPHVWYVQLIYDHRITVSGTLKLGLGIQFQYHFDSWRMPFNLLPTVQWQATRKTILRVAWDKFEIERLLSSRLSAVAEVRYDLSFFRLRNSLSWELESWSAGGGLNFRMSRDWYVRLRYKEMLLHREDVRLEGNTIEDFGKLGGRSVKLSVVKEY